MCKRIPLVLVGHSYGSVVAEGVAARSEVVDALVVTGVPLPADVLHRRHVAEASRNDLFTSAEGVGPVGLEPTTRGLKVRCSTD
jgi:pimeloyl-ACP methyl ester carboxylesterase